ncbi:MAG: peptidyl-prolyl cis-trans isomerase [Bacteroidales bacterium]|nr:peptidyl-prolyl cis-trans isomerase [Bacteroidales bacterium]
MKRIVLVFILLICLLGGCNSFIDHKGKTPLVEVGGKFLYQEDLADIVKNKKSDDSLLLAEQYIRSWIEEELLYDNAQRNIPNMESIEQLVESYKKSLIVHTYKQELIKQRLSTHISEKEIEQYYDEHKELFVLEQPMIQGLFMKVPQAATGINNVRRWYKQEDSTAIEHLEKYSLHNAVKYEYFYDKWIPAETILEMLPSNSMSLSQLIDNARSVELQDSIYYYFLNISEIRKVGDQEPLEYAKQKINDILVNYKQVDFIKQVKNDLYQEAVKRNKIQYNY